jgi:hypothetical protein
MEVGLWDHDYHICIPINCLVFWEMISHVGFHPRKDKRAGLPVERIGGRFITAYNPDLALQIVEKLAEGQTLNEICKADGYPHQVTFKRWVVAHPELAKAVDAARQLSAQSLEEEALDAAREIRRAQRDGTQVRAFEVAIQQLRWSAERRDPARFGNRAPVSIRVPIQIVTTLDLGADAADTAMDKDIYSLTAGVTASPEAAIEKSREIIDVEPIFPKEKSHGKGTKA